MMETQLSGVMDDQLIEELQRIAQRFLGKQVRIIIEENNGEKRRKRNG
jgi:hypothetical protein